MKILSAEYLEEIQYANDVNVLPRYKHVNPCLIFDYQ